MTPEQEQKLITTVERLDTTVEKLVADVEKFNNRFSDYQQAMQWVVQLAFSLIAAATITIIASKVLGR